MQSDLVSYLNLWEVSLLSLDYEKVHGEVEV